MSRRRVDARFLLPSLPRTAIVIGENSAWRDGLREAGVEVIERAAGPADLVVAEAGDAAAAVAERAGAIILEGKGRAATALRQAGLAPRTYVPFPTCANPEVVFPLAHRRAAQYALSRWTVPRSPSSRIRRRAVTTRFGAAVAPLLRPVVTTASAKPALPALLSAAGEIRPIGPEWYLEPGRSERSNAAFFLFGPDTDGPEHVLTFGPLPGSAKLEEAERGLVLATRAGITIAERAPSLVGRVRADGHAGLLQTAARGTSLQRLLSGPAARDVKVAALDRVAQWLQRVAKETATPPLALEPWRNHLEQHVLARWSAHGLSADLARNLHSTPAVFRHGDPTPHNVIINGRSFMLIDWESAHEFGMPLWDLIRLSSFALPTLDRPGKGERVEYWTKLFCGQASASGLLFSWLRAVVAALGLTPEAVGAITTLYWLDRAAKADRRTEGPLIGDPVPLMARRWLSHPELGPGWQTWRTADLRA